MGIKKAVLFAVVLFISATSVWSQKYTNYEISLGLNGAYTTYNSSFSQLPGIRNNYKDFTGASGMGLAISGGFQYIFEERLFGARVKYGGFLSYFSLSADYSENEFIGNYLLENSSADINVNHKLECTVNMIGTEHYAFLFPWDNIPVSFKLGVLIAFPITSDVYQVEKITAPQNVNFKETHQPVVNEYSGKIPDFGSFYPAISVGARYDLPQQGNFVISPEISYNYGFLNIHNSLDWKANQIRFGVNIAYKVEKPAAPRPPAPPMPMEPEPPTPPVAPTIAKLDAKFRLLRNNNVINDNDTLSVELPAVKSIYTGTYLPLIFFEENSYEVESGQGDQILRLTVTKMRNQPDLKVKMVLAKFGEDSTTIAYRKTALLSYFTSQGISGSRINSEIITGDKPKSDKLEEEAHYVRFEFSDGEKLLSVRKEFDKVSDADNVDIEVRRTIHHDAPLTGNEITLHYSNTDNEANFRTYFVNPEENKFDIPQNLITANSKGLLKVSAYLNVKDSAGNFVSDTSRFFVKPRVEYKKTVINPVDSDEQQANYELFELCYFRYDQADIYAYDKDALDYIKKQIIEGRQVEIVPSTDDLGTADYNQRLAQKRGDAALSLLGIKGDNVSINITGASFYPNKDTYQRNLNRGVFVKVYY